MRRIPNKLIKFRHPEKLNELKVGLPLSIDKNVINIVYRKEFLLMNHFSSRNLHPKSNDRILVVHVENRNIQVGTKYWALGTIHTNICCHLIQNQFQNQTQQLEWTLTKKMLLMERKDNRVMAIRAPMVAFVVEDVNERRCRRIIIVTSGLLLLNMI